AQHRKLSGRAWRFRDGAAYARGSRPEISDLGSRGEGPAAPLRAIGAAGVPRSFASRLIAWQGEHGRRDLPWQRTRDSYRIWLSEIMLQQTQVATVVPYYQRF